MPTIEKTIEVDLDDFTSEELRDELDWRGESVNDIDDYDDDELIVEIESRGYVTHGSGQLPNIPRENVKELYTTYMTMSSEFFEKELKKFFNETLDVYVR
jgi:hypothetical protein